MHEICSAFMQYVFEKSGLTGTVVFRSIVFQKISLPILKIGLTGSDIMRYTVHNILIFFAKIIIVILFNVTHLFGNLLDTTSLSATDLSKM